MNKRKDMRYPVNLAGYFYYNLYDGKTPGYITIKDLSRSGLMMELTETNNHIKINDKLRVSINLDDHKKTPIRKYGIVKHITGRQVGVEFCTKDNNDELDLYLYYHREQSGHCI